MNQDQKHPIRLLDSNWQRILDYLRTRPDMYVSREENCRRVVEGVLWMVRGGAQWRLLPAAYGNWNTVYKRFADWSKKGIWRERFEHFADDLDLEYVLIDSTTVRSHACACGYKKGIRKPWAAAGVG